MAPRTVTTELEADQQLVLHEGRDHISARIDVVRRQLGVLHLPHSERLPAQRVESTTGQAGNSRERQQRIHSRAYAKRYFRYAVMPSSRIILVNPTTGTDSSIPRMPNAWPPIIITNRTRSGCISTLLATVRG